MNKKSDNDIIVFSFILGILAFFALKERRIASIKRKITSTTPGENVRKDWLSVGSDLSTSFKRLTN